VRIFDATNSKHMAYQGPVWAKKAVRLLRISYYNKVGDWYG